MPTATVWSSAKSGEKIRIYLEQRTATTAIIQLATWGASQNPNIDHPRSLIAYDLYHVRAVSPSEITCKADGPGPFDPSVDCRLAAAADGGVVAITVPLLIDAQYAVGEEDFEELVLFLKVARFPRA